MNRNIQPSGFVKKPAATAPPPATPTIPPRISASSAASQLKRMSNTPVGVGTLGGSVAPSNSNNSTHSSTNASSSSSSTGNNYSSTNNNSHFTSSGQGRVITPPPPPPQSAKPLHLSSNSDDAGHASPKLGHQPSSYSTISGSQFGKPSPANTPPISGTQSLKKFPSVNLSSSGSVIPPHPSPVSSPNFFKKPAAVANSNQNTPPNPTSAPTFKRVLHHSSSTNSLTNSPNSTPGTSPSPSPTQFTNSPRSQTPPIPSESGIARPIAKKPALPPRESFLNTNPTNNITIPRSRGALPKPPAKMNATSTINAKKFLKAVIIDKEDNSSDEEEDNLSSSASSTSSTSSSTSTTPRTTPINNKQQTSANSSANNTPSTGSPSTSTPSSPNMIAKAKRPMPAVPGSTSTTSTTSTPTSPKQEKADKDKAKSKEASDITQRNYLVQEILSTEKKYINNLNRIITIFVLPLRDKAASKDKILSVDEINSIFMNIETIFNIHKTFLTDFESRIDKWTDTQKIGDVFLKMAPFLRAYTVYSNSYNSSILLLSSLTKSNPNFASFLSKCLLKPASKGLNLSSYLIMPIQRIPRYKLLLENLLAKSPENHVDYVDLKEAESTIGAVATELNERLMQFQIKHKVLDIQNSLVGMDEDIVKPTRVFLKEGDLKKISDRVVNTRHFFLFNDLLIYAQKQSKTLYSFKHSFPLLQCWVKDLPDTARFNYLFQIISPNKTYFLCAPTESDKQSWMKMLNEVINNLVQQNPESETQRSSIYEKRGSMTPNEILKQLDSSIPTEDAPVKIDELRTKPIWMKDQMVKACMHCSSSFTMTRRRHHCRKCGKIFCNDCCPVTDLSQYLPGKKARICKTCLEEISVQLTEMINHSPDTNEYGSSPPLSSSFSSQFSIEDEPPSQYHVEI